MIGNIRWRISENLLIDAKISQISLTQTGYSQFCPKFRCHGNGGRSAKNAIGSIRWPIPENPPIGAKNLAKISYASRVIAHFVPNFIAMATRGREREWGRKIGKGKGKGKKKGKNKGKEKEKGKEKGLSLIHI